MTKNNKIEDSLNKIFSTSGYKMIDVSSKKIFKTSNCNNKSK